MSGFFERRRHRKFVAELRASRHMWDDLLSPADRRRFDALIAECADAASGSPDALPAARRAAMEALRKVDVPDRHPKVRELLDLLLVVGAVAFGIRALFFQPFQIPTGSMQPTLYGIHFQYPENASSPRPEKLPGFLNAALFGQRRARAVSAADGWIPPEAFDEYGRPSARFFRSASLFFDRTRFPLGGASVDLPGAPSKVVEYARLYPGRVIRRGETLADGSLSFGDHLFVERFGLYLREPRRGDVTVFTTEGLRIPAVIDGTRQFINLSDVSGFFYIKRLAGLPGDTLRIENAQLMVRPAGAKEFRPVQELAEPFRKVYSGRGGYQGHVNGIGEQHLFPGDEYTVPPDHYFMLGDNSRFSQDSRFFGAVPRRNLVGRAWFVFWPFNRRWGGIDRLGPLDIPTGEHSGATFPVMYRQ